MLHHEELDEIRRAREEDEFLLPWYGGRSIAEIVPTVETLLGVPTRRATLPRHMWQRFEGAKRVVLLVLDGFAYAHLAEHYRRSPLLTRIVERGSVHPITSVFPSTTPAALTTLHSGLTPLEHGLPEWTVFFEEIDAIIETLPFRLLATHGRDTLLDNGGASEMLYDGPTAYADLAKGGVRSYVFNYFEYADSAYSRATQKGANLLPYTNVMDLLAKLRKLLHEERGPAYAFVYWGNIDSVMHKYGPNSPEHLAELDYFADTFEKELFAKLPAEDAADTVFMVTADHGHAKVLKDRMLLLNRYSALEEGYQRTKAHHAILPTGGPQDVFLFMAPEKIEPTLHFLHQELEGRAVVLPMEEAIARGLFGTGEASPKLLRRVGNVLVLPRKGHHIWYEHSPASPFRQLGTHGGLSEEEMLVPLVVADLAALRSEA